MPDCKVAIGSPPKHPTVLTVPLTSQLRSHRALFSCSQSHGFHRIGTTLPNPPASQHPNHRASGNLGTESGAAARPGLLASDLRNAAALGATERAGLGKR